MQTFIFDVLSPRDPFLGVVYKDEFGNTILHSFRQFQKNPSENYIKPFKRKTKIEQHNFTKYVFDSSRLFEEKGYTNLIYFNEYNIKNSKSNVECKKIKLLVIIDFAPYGCSLGLAKFPNMKPTLVHHSKSNFSPHVDFPHT